MSNPLSAAQVAEARRAQEKLFDASHYPAHKSLCPTCLVDRDVLREMMAERLSFSTPTDMETANHATARFLIGNCPDCEAWWASHG